MRADNYSGTSPTHPGPGGPRPISAYPRPFALWIWEKFVVKAIKLATMSHQANAIALVTMDHEVHIFRQSDHNRVARDTAGMAGIAKICEGATDAKPWPLRTKAADGSTLRLPKDRLPILSFRPIAVTIASLPICRLGVNR